MNYDATFKAKARAREVFDDFLNDLMASPPCTPAPTVFRPPHDPNAETLRRAIYVLRRVTTDMSTNSDGHYNKRLRMADDIDQFQRTLRDHSLS